MPSLFALQGALGTQNGMLGVGDDLAISASDSVVGLKGSVSMPSGSASRRGTGCCRSV